MAAIAPIPSAPDLGPPEHAGATITSNRLSLSTKWMNSSVVRITAAGKVDASNAGELGHYVFRHAANCRRLILDLTDVDLFGTAGFTTLRTIDSRCARAAVDWTLISSGAVSRVLEICDPSGTLPVAT